MAKEQAEKSTDKSANYHKRDIFHETEPFIDPPPRENLTFSATTSNVGTLCGQVDECGYLSMTARRMREVEVYLHRKEESGQSMTQQRLQRLAPRELWMPRSAKADAMSID